MYHDAAIYDALYDYKDYRAEAEQLIAMIDARRPGARTLLDVACGTGRHVEHFKNRFDVQGFDLNEDLLVAARERNPEAVFHQGDMRDLDLGRRFDAVTCLFSAIGHLGSVEELQRSAATFSRHLEPGGLLLIEPWITPEKWRSEREPHAQFVDRPDLKIARIHLSELHGRVAVMDMHHLVGTPEGVRHLVERLETFLFSHEEYLEAFERAGLTVEFDPEGPIGRGLYLAAKTG